MRSSVSRVALYGFLGSGNIGNDASFETVLDWLRAGYADIDVRCITLAPSAVQARYGIPSAPLTVPPVLTGGRVRSAAARLTTRLADIPRSLSAARSADAIVVPGMGVLEESLGVHPWGFPAWLFLQAAACRLLRRPFVLLAVGAEPVVNPVTRWLFTATVRLAAHVSYRDGFSADSMREAGARPPEAVSADLAFAHPASRHADPEPGRIVVGVLSYYGRHDDQVRGLSIHLGYVRSMADVIVRLAGQGDKIVLVGGDEVDTKAAREILAEARRIGPGLPQDAVTVRDVTTFTELSSEMARAEAVVASRFHNLIGALRLGRPTVSVGYAEKSARLMRSAGLDDYHQHIEDLDGDRLIAQLQGVRDQAPVLAKQIAAACDDYADQVGVLLASLARDVLGRPPVGGEFGHDG
jgi:polysaccharide pyruvyl transferase WcaK-like protein